MIILYIFSYKLVSTNPNEVTLLKLRSDPSTCLLLLRLKAPPLL